MDDEEHGVFFVGRWREFLPIALTNLLLTVVTLGFYRFWAITRTRRYLWSRTFILGEPLEWTGLGTELFKGFILATALVALPLLFLQYGMQMLIFGGYGILAALLGLLAILCIIFLTGVARFRALRYRLSRTYWRGIRGGSIDSGLAYGLAHLLRYLAGCVTIGLLVPWSMMSLWNQRMNSMSYGSYAFISRGEYQPIFRRFLLFYISPLLILASAFVIAASLGIGPGPIFLYADIPGWLRIVGIFVVVVGSYCLLGMILLIYRAGFFREALNNLSLDNLSFGFDASTDDWFQLFLGDLGLMLCTLGLAYPFLEYRHWRFFLSHLNIYGSLDFEGFTQSTLNAPRQGEGLAGAFDVGGF